MSLNLHDLFPEGISDETAFHLVEFFMSIATELDSHYFPQTRRYRDDSIPIQPPEYLQKYMKNKIDVDDNF
jgi:hypothetical protein